MSPRTLLVRAAAVATMDAGSESSAARLAIAEAPSPPTIPAPAMTRFARAPGRWPGTAPIAWSVAHAVAVSW